MQLPDGIRKSANVLFCLVAVAGIGFSGREIWQNAQARWQIDAGCGGLVPAGRVLALDRAGGEITHRLAEEGTIELDQLASEGAQDCELFSEKLGGRWFFTGTVGVFPTAGFVVADNVISSPLDQEGGETYPAQPLGGGITGSVDDLGVTVKLDCSGGELDGEPVDALWARAELHASVLWLEHGQPGDHDRNVLAETAVITANNLAERLGCAERLPDPPADVPALPEGTVPVGRAEGTCAWYRESGLAERDGFPDEALEGRVDDTLWDERCALILTEGEAWELYYDRAGGLESPDDPGEYGDWFITFHTYLGEDARKVKVPRIGDDPVTAPHGTAGRGPDRAIWWASSTCDGRPQIHTMTIASGYDRLVAAETEDLFRAYVTEITDRRDCTDLAFPESGSFRSPLD
ncbi:hypothetical protein ABZX40_38940 [Streptomyces sp. NPDC004610]|uniref:hypothetical protein n=1 Tax=unclassified Streptomyces TaxID=2593676 RepID=UPI0033ACB921